MELIPLIPMAGMSALRKRLQRVRLIGRSLAHEELDAIDILELWHLKIDALFRRLMAARGWMDRSRIYDELKLNLLAHSVAEEEVFYPAFETRPRLRGTVFASREEHALMRQVLARLDQIIETASPPGTPDSWREERFNAGVALLYRNVDRHVLEEETQLFPLARRLVLRRELVQLGQRISKIQGRESERQAAVA